MSAGATRASAHRALPPGDWPPEDRLAWDAAQAGAGFLEAGGPAAVWRPASRASVHGGYARWLGWLSDQGVALAAEGPPERVTPERVRAYVAFLRPGRSPVTVATCLAMLSMACAAMFPDRDWAWLRSLRRRLARRAAPARDRRGRLVPAHELLRLGLDLMDEADGALRRTASAPADDRARRATACLFRDGLLIALLASRPLRASNLLAIALGVHLRTAAQGRATLRFAAAETKGGRPIETTWPESLGPGLRRYLEEARPVLLAAAGPAASGAPTGPAPAARAALWIGRTGAPLGHGGLREALKRHTRRRFGHAVNAHLFRACAATTIVDADPSLVRHAAALLGHGGVRIAERSYVLADPRIALERHHDRIAAMRGTARGRRGARQGGADR